MKRKKVDSSLERAFLTGLITDKQFLARAAPLTDTELFPQKYVKQIARWCFDYYAQYRAAPNRDIEAIYHAWVEREKPDPTDADAISDFLGVVSADYDAAPALNVPHLIDELIVYLTARKIGNLSDELTSHLAYGKTAEAVAAIQTFRTVGLGEATGFVPHKGKAVWEETFSQSHETIIDFPGDAGRFLGPACTRDALLGMQGAEKTGKTWWCLEFVYRAVRSHCRVAMFEVGDLSKSQLMKRWAVRISGLPLRASQTEVQFPTQIEIVDNKAKVEYQTQKFSHPVDAATAYRAQKRFNKTHRIKNTQPQFMFSVHSNGSINVAGINSILEQWRQELGFVADCIIIDYADILAPETRLKENRDQVNETWSALRRLSQQWHACVIAPTQADAASYEVKTQSRKNFSNDKRKYAHVTGMLGLNQTRAEKQQGTMRLNWLQGREFGFDEKQCLWVAQCIPLATAHVKSVLPVGGLPHIPANLP